MPQNFRDRISLAIDEGHPLAWEIYSGLVALGLDDRTADWFTADLLWRHSEALQTGRPH